MNVKRKAINNSTNLKNDVIITYYLTDYHHLFRDYFI